jgi:7tm Chemosensory receptor
MWSNKPVWLAWFLLYLFIRLSGAIPFSYNFRRSRFEPSLIALLYTWAVVLAFCAFHPAYVSLYMTRIVAAYGDYIIYQTSNYYFKLGSVAFVLFYLQQIRRRSDLVKLLNDGLTVIEQSRDLYVENSLLLTYVAMSFVAYLLFSSLMVSNQYYVLDESVKEELFLTGVITVIPYFTLNFFGFTWVLLVSLVVHVNLKINSKIKQLTEIANTDHQVLKELSAIYYKLYHMTCQINRLSSLIVVINHAKAFLGVASLVS